MTMPSGFERWIEACVHQGTYRGPGGIRVRRSAFGEGAGFRELAMDIALQVAAMAPESVEALLAQNDLKHPEVLVDTRPRMVSAVLGDRVRIVRFERWVTTPDRVSPGDAGDPDPPRSPANIMRIPRCA